MKLVFTAWKALPSKTLASHQESRGPGYKVSKERVPILACVNVTGDHKLPLITIGKAETPIHGFEECIYLVGLCL